MKSIALLFFFNLFLFKVQSQKTIDIPEFKNLNSKDQYPLNAILSLYSASFDILISLNTYSAWGPDNSIKVLAHHNSGWYKIEINHDEKVFDPYTVCISTYKFNDSIGNIVWDVLKQNHLFDMKDGRQIQATCITTDTIQYRKGKFKFVEVFHDNSSDGAEYKFEIVTKKNYKQIYFYSPQDLVDVCPDPERKQIINCINVFEQHLGK